MKIAYIIPGSGGSFYCENCMRDAGISGELASQGFEVCTIPMYLPLFKKPDPGEQPLFYSAVELYLREQYTAFRNIPGWLKRFLGSRVVLSIAAGLAGSTRASGLADMTISMLKGEQGKSGEELERLVHWLSDIVKPDVVHLSNALLLGMGARIRKETGIPVICSLQDEHTWIEPMNMEAANVCWTIMQEKARKIDGFVAVSKYYSQVMQSRLLIPVERINVVPPGIAAEIYANCLEERKAKKGEGDAIKVIGFLSRFEASSGLDLLIEAVSILKNKHGMDNIRVQACGGMTADDTAYLHSVKKLLRSTGLGKSVIIKPHYSREQRFDLLARSDVLCVPRTTPEAFGMFLLEAFACGIPVVQPDLGAFPEIVGPDGSGAGLLFTAGDPIALAQALLRVLSDKALYAEMGRAGCLAADGKYRIGKVAAELGEIYKNLI